MRMAVLGQFPPGTTLEYLRSDEKTALDFAEIAGTNTSLTAPYAFAAPVGTLTFEAPEGARLDRCLPGEGFSVTPAP